MAYLYMIFPVKDLFIVDFPSLHLIYIWLLEGICVFPYVAVDLFDHNVL
jgi:hypothetical protein